MSLRKALLAATLLSLPMAATANAQSWDPRVTGVYVGAGLGTNYLDDSDSDRNISISFEWGYVGVLSVGYGFGNGLRLEVEGNYRQNDVDTISNNGGNIPRTTGTVRSYGAMINALYDFNLGPVMPYVGVGAGYVWNDYDSVGFNYRNGNQAGQFTAGGTNGAFGYQAILGVAFPIQSVPGLALTAEGRFMGTTGDDIDGRANVNATVNGQVLNARENVKFSTDNYNWSILFGVRYNFGRTAAPVVPVAAAPAPARTFLVFFDWNRADLTARARQIIGEAAQARTTPGGDPHRSERLHRHVGLRSVQPGPVGPPRQCGGWRAGAPGRAARRDRRPWLRRDEPAGSDPGQHPRAAEPPRGNHPALISRSASESGKGRRRAPLSAFRGQWAVPRRPVVRHRAAQAQRRTDDVAGGAKRLRPRQPGIQGARRPRTADSVPTSMVTSRVAKVAVRVERSAPVRGARRGCRSRPHWRSASRPHRPSRHRAPAP